MSAASQAALRLVEGSSMDKSKALEAALSQIERNFGKGSIMKLGKNDRSMDVDTIPSGSLSAVRTARPASPTPLVCGRPRVLSTTAGVQLASSSTRRLSPQRSSVAPTA